MPPRFPPVLVCILFLATVGTAQPPTETLPAPRRTEAVPPEPAPVLPPAPIPVLPPAPLPEPIVGAPVPSVGASCAPPLIEKTLPYTPMLLVPHETATTLPDWKLHPVEVARIPAGPALDFHEEKQIVTVLELRPHQVDQQVTCTESKPVTVTDCHGHCHTEYQPCSVVKVVKVTVYETVPVQRIVLVRVPYLKDAGELSVKNLVLDPRTVPAVETRYSVVESPNELKVLVPAPACTAPGCAGPHPLHP